MLVLIDNYDSFTYNLVHFLGSRPRRRCFDSIDASRAAEAFVPARPLASSVVKSAISV